MTTRNILPVIAAVLALASAATAEAPRYVILFVASGLGNEQLKAASIYRYGAPDRLQIHRLPHSTNVKVMPAADGPADEAAAATALATGNIVNRGVISMHIPGSAQDNPNAQTILEYSRDNFKRAMGVVTDACLTDPAPAAFVAHQPSAEFRREIADDYLQRTRPHVIAGIAGPWITPENAAEAGYTVLQDSAALAAEASQPTGLPTCALLPADDMPTLADLTRAVIDMLEPAPDGFFLVVHTAAIDRAGRRNDLEKTIAQVEELDAAVALARDWAAGREEALLMVTSTLETAGLEVLTNYGMGALPEVRWSQTQAPAIIPVYAMGRNADIVSMIEDGKNTELCVVLTLDRYIPRPRSRTMSIAIAASFALLVIMWIFCRGAKRADLQW